MEGDVQGAVADFLAVDNPKLSKIPTDVRARLIVLSQLVAALRVEPSKTQYFEYLRYRPETEVSTRLVKQLGKLWVGLDYVDRGTRNDTYALVERVALCTGIPFHLDILLAVDQLEHTGQLVTRSAIARVSELPYTTATRRVDDLVLCKTLKMRPLAKTDRADNAILGRNRGGRPPATYTFAKRIRRLWDTARVGTGGQRRGHRQRHGRREHRTRTRGRA